jgi:hypothetical protein
MTRDGTVPPPTTARPAGLSALLAVDDEHPDANPETAAAAAVRLLKQGEPLLAYNTVQEGLQRWPGHLRLRQLQALALARSGDTEDANRLLRALAAEGLDDAETLGMLARTHKDLGLTSRDRSEREAHLTASFELYARAYGTSREREVNADAYYTGINAATLAVLRGDVDAARRLAREVEAICTRLRGGGTPDYWSEATLGEAALILGETAVARRHYAAAARLAGVHYGDLSSTRRQAELLAQHLRVDGSWIAGVLQVPPVVVYSGHMLDHPTRDSPRFPPALEGAVRDALRARLTALRPLAAYGSAACGTDLLVLELVRQLGGETHIVLPFPPDEFREVSIDFAGGDWAKRFERALIAADSVTVTSDHRASDSTSPFEYANLVFTGMGRLRAQVLQTSLCAFAVLDSGAGGAAGGTAAIAALWRSHGLQYEQVDVAQLRRESPPVSGPAAGGAGGAPQDTGAAATHAPAPSRAPRHEMRAMLFADAVGFSQLSEDQIPGFVTGFLGAVAALNERTRHRPEHVETSGDGLYMVFGDVGDAARYALELSDLVNGVDHEAAGLPPGFNLRIGLHCGPVYCGWNPVTKAPLYTGPHTSRTARIEPITPPGQVYASSAFAAVASASGVDDLAMRYIGRLPLAKNYGTLAVYHVRPARATDSSSIASEPANSP